ncbi:MAG: YfhO family protein [Oscillospiraceae bacterium]
MEKLKNINVYQKAFLLGLFTAFCIFLPFMVVDKGFFVYAGDFNSQQIPFYMYANQMVKSGAMNWSWATDLGSSFVNSYSFYLLGSPLFWLSCLFPYKAVPYILPYLLMLKFAVGSLGAFGYLRRYAKNDNYALLGGLLYTFCGFSIYNIFFNHFIEAVVFFPFLLWALDEFVYNKRRMIFPLIVALCLLNNYFFFIGQVVFLFIYFIWKIITKEYVISLKEFANLSFEAFVGCLMGLVLFVPSLVSIFGNPRVNSTLSDFGIWLYSSVQQYFAIVSSAFLPPDPPYIPSLFTSCNVKWTSMSAFIAFGGLFGFFVFKKYNNRSSFYKIFITCIIFALVPIFNSLFYAFNSSYYARWFYMPMLMLAAMNMQSFSFDKEKIYHGLKLTAILTACFVVFGLTPIKDGESLFIGLADEVAIYWLNILVAFLNLYLVWTVVSNHHGKPRYTQKLISGGLSMIMLFSLLHMGLTKMPQWDGDQLYKPQNYDVIDALDFKDEGKDYRIDTYNCFDNLGLFLNKPCVQFFNSTISPSIMEFYPSIGVKRDVSSKPPQAYFALRSLLSIKYLVTPNWEVSNFNENGNLTGYTFLSSSYPYTIFKNDNFLPMGFAYDNYVSYEQLDSVLSSNRSNILLRAIALDEEVLKKYDLSLPKLSDDRLHDYTYSSTVLDVTKRRNMSSYFFSQTDDGFQCKINLNQANLVFFSVPYDKGFTAYVNGEKSEVIKVSYGMSAVYAPQGDNEIIFTYRTPYLFLGYAISGFGLAIYLLYVIILKRSNKSKGNENGNFKCFSR